MSLIWRVSTVESFILKWHARMIINGKLQAHVQDKFQHPPGNKNVLCTSALVGFKLLLFLPKNYYTESKHHHI